MKGVDKLLNAVRDQTRRTQGKMLVRVDDAGTGHTTPFGLTVYEPDDGRVLARVTAADGTAVIESEWPWLSANAEHLLGGAFGIDLRNRPTDTDRATPDDAAEDAFLPAVLLPGDAPLPAARWIARVGLLERRQRLAQAILDGKMDHLLPSGVGSKDESGG